MDEFLKSLSTLDWVVIYVVTILIGANAALRVVVRIQKIQLKRLELKHRRLEEELHPEGDICPAIQHIAEVIPDLCPQCSQLIKWKVKEGLEK